MPLPLSVTAPTALRVVVAFLVTGVTLESDLYFSSPPPRVGTLPWDIARLLRARCANVVESELCGGGILYMIDCDSEFG